MHWFCHIKKCSTWESDHSHHKLIKWYFGCSISASWTWSMSPSLRYRSAFRACQVDPRPMSWMPPGKVCWVSYLAETLNINLWVKEYASLSTCSPFTLLQRSKNKRNGMCHPCTAQSLVNEISSYYSTSMAKSSLTVKMGKKKRLVQTIITISLVFLLLLCFLLFSAVLLKIWSHLVKPPVFPLHPYPFTLLKLSMVKMTHQENIQKSQV